MIGSGFRSASVYAIVLTPFRVVTADSIGSF